MVKIHNSYCTIRKYFAQFTDSIANNSLLKLITYFKLRFRLRARHWEQNHNEFLSPTTVSGMDSHSGWYQILHDKHWTTFLYFSGINGILQMQFKSMLSCLRVRQLEFLRVLMTGNAFIFPFKRQFIKCCLIIAWSNLSERIVRAVTQLRNTVNGVGSRNTLRI